jgi:hypothetical protein
LLQQQQQQQHIGIIIEDVENVNERAKLDSLRFW